MTDEKKNENVSVIEMEVKEDESKKVGVIDKGITWVKGHAKIVIGAAAAVAGGIALCAINSKVKDPNDSNKYYLVSEEPDSDTIIDTVPFVESVEEGVTES